MNALTAGTKISILQKVHKVGYFRSLRTNWTEVSSWWLLECCKRGPTAQLTLGLAAAIHGSALLRSSNNLLRFSLRSNFSTHLSQLVRNRTRSRIQYEFTELHRFA